jgi:hypothetical protein
LPSQGLPPALFIAALDYNNEMNFSRKIVENLLHMPAISPLKVMGMMYGDMCIPLTSALLKTNGKKNIAMKLECLT